MLSVDFCKLWRLAVKSSFASKVKVKDSWFTHDEYKDIMRRIKGNNHRHSVDCTQWGGDDLIRHCNGKTRDTKLTSLRTQQPITSFIHAK